MIPKKIHYCWFGEKEKPLIVQKCINSWKLILPDYEIIEWNEKNTLLDCHFAKNAYLKRKWAFLSDYTRIKILHEYGGIYLDTDMLVIKTLNELLHYKCFIGKQHDNRLNGSIIGSEAKHPFLEICMLKYQNMIFNEFELMNMSIPFILKDAYDTYLIQNIIHEIKVFESSFFYPYPFEESLKKTDYTTFIKSDTIAVHLWNASWFSNKEIAGFAFKNKKHLKALTLLIGYFIKNPSFILKDPSFLFRELKKKIFHKAGYSNKQ